MGCMGSVPDASEESGCLGADSADAPLPVSSTAAGSSVKQAAKAATIVRIRMNDPSFLLDRCRILCYNKSIPLSREAEELVL